jgi:hypothetical protein
MVPWGNEGGRGEGVKFSFLDSKWRAPPSSRLAQRQRGIGFLSYSN